MTRPKAHRARPDLDDMDPEKLEALRAELLSRLARIRENIDTKRRIRGMVEVADGVWVMPDGTPAPPPGQPYRC